MYSLPNDVSRCSNQSCSLRSVCKRSLAAWYDKKENTLISTTYFPESGCEHFIEVGMVPGTIWVANQRYTIKPDDVIKSTRRLTSFSVSFLVRNALVKSQGGWYWLDITGRLNLVASRLSDITFRDIFDINKKELIEKHNNENHKS